MKQLLKLAAVAWVFCGMSNSANAFLLTFLLNTGGGTWTLKAKTDAPGGIASFVVDLQNATTGVSAAPRGTFGGNAVNGFTLGNAFAAQQASARQDTSNPATIVYGLGPTDVAPAAFGAPVPFTLVGSGIRDADGFITLYHGTGIVDWKLNEDGSYRVSGSVFGTVGDANTVGQEIFPGLNLTVEPPYSEPSSCILVALTVPAFIYAARRRRAMK